MRARAVRPKLRVQITDLQSVKGWAIEPEYLRNRQIGVKGTVQKAVDGHGELVWWVKHDGTGTVAAYGFPEMEPLPERPLSQAWENDKPLA